jgi:hypothetical protein
VKIRTATKGDLPRIMELGEEFGHRMLYQKDKELMSRYLPRILVAIDRRSPYLGVDYPEVVGYYHYIVSGDPGFEEMLRCYRQFPESLIQEAWGITSTYAPGELCVVMQGGCHRDAFKEIITYLQLQYPEIWCWNSVTDPDKPSSKIAGYKELGFTYNPNERFTFWNVHKGDHSTYQLGRWRRN